MKSSINHSGLPLCLSLHNLLVTKYLPKDLLKIRHATDHKCAMNKAEQLSKVDWQSRRAIKSEWLLLTLL